MSASDLTGALLAFEKDAFERGRAAGQGDAAGGDRNTPLAQINRMGRQIEESHAALRRRGEEMKILEARVRTLEGAAEAERERIIKLIENYKAPCECGSLYITVCYAHRLIALIKGEN